MVNSVRDVNSSALNTSTYNRAQSAQLGQTFSSILQTKMNTNAMSIADFSDDNSSEESNTFSNSLYGNGNGGNGLYGGLGNGLLTGANSTGSTSGSGLNSETMLMFILLALVMGSDGGDGSNMMLTSLTDALMGGNDYSNYRSVALQNTQNSTFKGLSLTGSAYKSTYVTPGSGSYPSNMGKACSPKVVNNVGNRSAGAYNSVIQQFNVESNSRYTPYKNGSTYCNIYVWDVTTAMGAQIPHRVDANGDIAAPGTKNIKYMTANSMYNWLGDKGKEYGWKEVSAEEAQRYANMGCPAVASWKNPKGHGHIQMVVPSKDGKYNQSKGVAISQAGSKVIEYGYISDVYKSSRLKDIKYFVHA